MSKTKKDLLSGVFWSAVEKYSCMLISLVISMILARLLAPEDYGVVAIATVIIFFLQIFTSMGIAPAIIQKKDLLNNDIDNIYSLTIYVGLFLSLLFFIASYVVAYIYDNQLLIPVCKILSIHVFFSAANMVPNALILKAKRFKDIARRTVVLQISTGIISIVAAYSGYGVYSLLISPVFTAIGVFFWNRFYYPVHFRLIFSTASVKKIFSYSLYQFLFEFVNYFSRNLDKLLIGKYISVAELGFYEKSYRLMQMPLNSLTSVFNPVLQPVLSEYQENKDEIRKKYEKVIHYIALISFPLGLFLYICAKEIIIILYGEQWGGAISAFEVLALSIPLQIILSTTGGIFQACDATRNLFYVGLRNSAITISGFIIALIVSGTIEAVAWGWTITSYLCFLSSFYEFYHGIYKTPIRYLFVQLKWPFSHTAIVIVIYLIVCDYIPTNIYFSFILKLLLVAVISLVLFFVTSRIHNQRKL